MDPGRERELQGSAAPDIMLATQLELAKSRETHNILPLEIHHPKYMGDTPQQTYGAAAKHLLSLHSNGRCFQPCLPRILSLSLRSLFLSPLRSLYLLFPAAVVLNTNFTQPINTSTPRISRF